MTLNIGIFCGSKIGTDEKHLQLTKKVVAWIGSKKFNIVFGGSQLGLMKVVSTEAKKFDIKIYGIIPDFLSYTIDTKKFIITDLIVTKTLEQRKKQFLQRSDCFLVLPGGIGTLNEMMDLIVKKELKEVSKPIFLVNDTNYWNPFIKLIEHFIKENFLDKDVFNKILNISALKTVQKKIEEIKCQK